METPRQALPVPATSSFPTAQAHAETVRHFQGRVPPQALHARPTPPDPMGTRLDSDTVAQLPLKALVQAVHARATLPGVVLARVSH